MSQSFLIQHLLFTRDITIATLASTSEEIADVIPKTSTNNIRWHLGHILVTQDQLLFGKLQENSGIPEHYIALFGRDTSPSNWKETGGVPSLKELHTLLDSQKDRITNAFNDQLEKPLPKPFTVKSYTIETFGHMVAFATWHEGYHHGFINGLKRAVNEKNLWPAKA
ncbi:DinB superfamily protein [Marininema mesophilum]|uniref:DinB superfamily protein n=1 Tax=Marininema mesophilum TaxID=1048340 RepID=A0A1H2U600_9BACL|nr:DinB family protein [Marininema mesophilum]SDW51531.1 DinB superfamily protein [Marininema mesophilum]